MTVRSMLVLAAAVAIGSTAAIADEDKNPALAYRDSLMTLVGVVDADLGLSNGDPRAAERTYQLLSQVTGRAGRSALRCR